MKNVSDKSSRRVGTWSINGRRLIVSEIDRRERYYDVQRHPSEGSLEKWSKLLIRSHKITRDCATNGIIRSSTAGNSNHSKLCNDIFHGVEGTTLFLRSVIISENPLDEYTRSFPVEKLDRIAEKHRLIGSWREFILQFHPARKPDAARCLSRREFRVDGF